MPPHDGEYGMMTSLYGWASVITVTLSMGLETTFQRYANKKNDELNPARVYSTAFLTIVLLVAIFGTAMLYFSPSIAYMLGYPSHVAEVKLTGAMICCDTLLVLPFCNLRYRHNVTKYATCKALYAFINALLCFLVLFLCPRLQERWPNGILWEFYLPNNALNYVMGCNLVTAIILLYILIDEWKPFGQFKSAWNRSYKFGYTFDLKIFKDMMVYAKSILTTSLLDIGFQNIDRMLYLWLVPGMEGMRQLGIYGACFRIGMIMALATQVLRDLSEPTIFRLARSEEAVKHIGAIIIKYFIIFSIIIFLGVETCMGFIQRHLLVNEEYWEGISIIPILMVSEMLVGLHFYTSFWYKLTDRPQYGTYFAVISLAVIIAINLLFVPRFGYIACAWAILTGCLVRLLLTLIVGRRVKSKYAFRFEGHRYIALGTIIFISMRICPNLGQGWSFAFKFLLLTLYVVLFYYFERNNILEVVQRINRNPKLKIRH